MQSIHNADQFPEYVNWLVVCPEDLDENMEFVLLDPGVIPFEAFIAPISPQPIGPCTTAEMLELASVAVKQVSAKVFNSGRNPHDLWSISRQLDVALSKMRDWEQTNANA